ncbi:MAG: helix-turn-helix transcriptional regulator [Undibacterium sp.]|uniref:helix-turn-helix domain-containing protein n=1 Tax=Undibacterium sp. TaxID=1914977 RepID=UPI00271B6CAB|nr:helix-turn-helix transcriptional regulator [Undibacterium sp.]MDO8651230.1 helix-turn-helix transcriptional regulator [Undibacterium sp.]
MKIGQVIRNLRLAKKSTLEDIAFVAEMDAANLSRIERGKQNPTPEITEKLATAFDLPVSALYLMAEQNIETYQVKGTQKEMKQVSDRLEDCVTRFMLLTPEYQLMVNEFITVMLKSQGKGE